MGLLNSLLSWLHIGVELEGLPLDGDFVESDIDSAPITPSADESIVQSDIELAPITPPAGDDIVQSDGEAAVADELPPSDELQPSDDAVGDEDQSAVVEVPPALSADDVTTSFAAGYMSGYLDGYSEVPAGAADEPSEYELVDVETYALSPITSSTGLKGVLIDVIGPYDNVVTQFTYRPNTSTNLSYVNEITPDYPWIGSCLLFIVLVLSVFRLAGRMLGWKK